MSERDCGKDDFFEVGAVGHGTFLAPTRRTGRVEMLEELAGHRAAISAPNPHIT